MLLHVPTGSRHALGSHTSPLSVEEEERTVSAITQDFITHPDIAQLLTCDPLGLQNGELHATAQYVKLLLLNNFNRKALLMKH